VQTRLTFVVLKITNVAAAPAIKLLALLQVEFAVRQAFLAGLRSYAVEMVALPERTYAVQELDIALRGDALMACIAQEPTSSIVHLSFGYCWPWASFYLTWWGTTENKNFLLSTRLRELPIGQEGDTAHGNFAAISFCTKSKASLFVLPFINANAPLFSPSFVFIVVSVPFACAAFPTP